MARGYGSKYSDYLNTIITYLLILYHLTLRNASKERKKARLGAEVVGVWKKVDGPITKANKSTAIRGRIDVQ